MARAQIVEKILAQIGNRIYVENEKVRPIIHDEALGLFETTGEIDLGARRGFPQGCENLRSEILRGFEHKNAPALFGRSVRMRRSLFVHNSKEPRFLRLVGVVRHALIRHACFQANEKYFSQHGRYVALARDQGMGSGPVSDEVKSAGVDARRDPISCVMHACGDPMSAIGFYRRAATAESCQEDGGAERE
jgi:hypothetical protein